MEAVKLVLKWGYALHLTLLCLVDTASMRLWVLANTVGNRANRIVFTGQ